MRRWWWDSKTNPWVSVLIVVPWVVLSVLSFEGDAVLFGVAWAVLAVAWACLAVAAFLRRRRLTERRRAHPDEDAPA